MNVGLLRLEIGGRSREKQRINSGNCLIQISHECHPRRLLGARGKIAFVKIDPVSHLAAAVLTKFSFYNKSKKIGATSTDP